MTNDELRLQVLGLLRTGWLSARELSLETGHCIGEVKKVLEELESEGLVFRDGFLYIHRLGMV